MSAAYQQIEQQASAFSSAREKFFALQQYLGSESSMRLTHAELETCVVERTRQIARDVVQGHLDLRAMAEEPVGVTGSDGIERKQHRSASKRLRMLVGDVTVQRLLYQACGVEGLAPQDGALSLARDCFSMGVRFRVVEEAVRGSFDEVVQRVESTTGTHVAKRQAKQLVQAAAVDFEEIYSTQSWQPESQQQIL